MKKLILLLTIVLASLTAFSQTVTKPSNDTGTVTLSKAVAKAIAQDLIRKDSLETEVKACKINYNLLSDNIKAKDGIIVSKDSIISLRDLEAKNLNGIIDLTNLQKTNLQNANDVLNKDLKKANHKLVVRTVIGSAIIASLAYLILK